MKTKIDNKFLGKEFKSVSPKLKLLQVKHFEKQKKIPIKDLGFFQDF